MSRAFDLALAFVLNVDVEGGYSNDPDDPGGETRFGISKHAHPELDITHLTRERAADVYRVEYWTRCRCDLLPAPIALALFDCAVNQGAGKAIRLLQRALGVDEDGIIGDETLNAANRAIPDELLIQFLSRRAVEYADGIRKFRRGWFVRLFRLQHAIDGRA